MRPLTELSFVGSNRFEISEIPLQQHAAVLDVSLGLKLGRDITLTASYSGQLSSGAVDQSTKANLSMRF